MLVYDSTIENEKINIYCWIVCRSFSICKTFLVKLVKEFESWESVRLIGWPNKILFSFLLIIKFRLLSFELFNFEIVEIVVKNFPSSVLVLVVWTVLFKPKRNIYFLF